MRHAEYQSTRPESRLKIGMIRTEQDSLFRGDQSAVAGSSKALQPVSLPITSRFGKFGKRLLDVAFCLPVIVLLLPILCVVVKLFQVLQSPGPLFYRQRRCGRDRRPFTIMKFRTMHVASANSLNAAEAAQRIFPLGSLLRDSKLDEIPQFLNVLFGSMSIVGPRPHHYDDCKQFEAAVQDYRHRVLAKPGITGLAQYTEYRGKFQWNCVESRVSQDLRYIQNWSLLLDIILILKTPVAICRRALAAVHDRLRPVSASNTIADTAPLIATIEHTTSMRHAEMPVEEKRRAA